jgi:hypothetical protein
MTSNMGQLLWSGIVPQDRAATVARQLMSEQMFSGRGVRTTSTADRGYNPVGYHNGTVWPHDNSLIAAGVARYRFQAEANRIVTAMLQAAKFLHYRLPEVLSGYDRSFRPGTRAISERLQPAGMGKRRSILFLRTMLGLDGCNGELLANPDIPPSIGQIRLIHTNAFGRRWDVVATATRHTFASPNERSRSPSACG